MDLKERSKQARANLKAECKLKKKDPYQEIKRVHAFGYQSLRNFRMDEPISETMKILIEKFTEAH
jgi:hypothetical protein